MGKLAFLFPGQGSQKPGMGMAFARTSIMAKRMFDGIEARWPGLRELCFHGDAEELSRTINAQRALFVVNWICASEAFSAGIRPDCVAGFSLGEWNAVAYAHMLSMDDALVMIDIRAKSMQSLSEAHPGAMQAVLKLSAGDVERICADIDGAWPVNYNCPGQTVVACEAVSVSKLIERVRAEGGRCVPLNTSGCFHTPHMSPTAKALRDRLRKASIFGMALPVYSNRTGRPFGADALEQLSSQASSPVRWQETLEHMASDGVDRFVEVGTGNTLAGFVRRTLPHARVWSVSDPDSLFACARDLREEGAIA